MLLLPIIIVQIITWSQFQNTYWDFFLEILIQEPRGVKNPLDTETNFLYSYYVAFGITIPLAILGYSSLNLDEKKMFGAMFIAYTVPNLLVATSIMYARFASLTFPFFVLLSAITIGSLIKNTPNPRLFFFILLGICVGSTFAFKYLNVEIVYISYAILFLGFCALDLLKMFHPKVSKAEETEITEVAE